MNNLDAIARAVRTYFIALGHINPTTDKQCKSWSVTAVSYAQSDETKLEHFRYAVNFSLIVFDACDGESCFETCGHDDNVYSGEEFSIMVHTMEEAEDLADYFTERDPDSWVLTTGNPFKI